jgi:hypothetical protein
MGGKKKAAAAATKKTASEPDETTEKLYKLYKKKCNELGCGFSQTLKEKFAEFADDGGDLTKVFTFPLSITILRIFHDQLTFSDSFVGRAWLGRSKGTH